MENERLFWIAHDAFPQQQVFSLKYNIILRNHPKKIKFCHSTNLNDLNFGEIFIYERKCLKVRARNVARPSDFGSDCAGSSFYMARLHQSWIQVLWR